MFGFTAVPGSCTIVFAPESNDNIIPLVIDAVLNEYCTLLESVMSISFMHAYDRLWAATNNLHSVLPLLRCYRYRLSGSMTKL